jgi:redox-sensitive bicupin YhaK (pirin superfamily)
MSAIRQTFPLGTQWPTIDPFLFVAHHLDDYPVGTVDLAPDASLDSRNIGQDFDGIDGWNMYHGSTVPGFPQHPNRGFETITYVRDGFCDHSDSLGATARFGRGDTQWMTAGKGIVHCEMFPMLNQADKNPLELFQIWLNLPAADKMVDPYFTMLWSHDTPTVVDAGPNGELVDITVIAGTLESRNGDTVGERVTAQAPPPNSWASRAEADLAIWHLRFDAGARWTMPAASGPETERVLYAFSGSWVTIDGERLDATNGALLDAGVALELVAGDEGVECMVLQGRPIGEPVARYGPFVMNTDVEIRQAFEDYQRTQFGGWPWPSDDPTHGAEEGRFALHADGKLERFELDEPTRVS